MVVTLQDYLPANTAARVPATPPTGSGLFSIGYSGPMPQDRLVDDPGNERAELTGLAELAATIAAEGQLEPIVVYPVGDGTFMITSGHRRRAALKRLEAPTAWVIVVAPPPDAGARILRRLTANLQRSDLTALEEARAYQALATQGLTQEEIAQRVGKSQPTIGNMLRLFGLPEPVQTLLAAGQLTARHGLELLAVPVEGQLGWDGKEERTRADVQIALATQAAEKGVSAKNVHDSVQALNNTNTQRREWAEQQRRQRAEETARRAAQQKRPLSPEEQAEIVAHEAAEAARRAKDAAAKAREESRLADRARQANAELDRLLAYDPAAPPNLEVLRLAAMVCIAGAHVHDPERKTFVQQIEAAPDAPTLVQLLAIIGRAALTLDSDRRAVGGFNIDWQFKEWADKRWGVNAAIADVLLGAKLINKRTHETLVSQAAKRPARVPARTQGDEQAALLVAAGRPEYAPICKECGGPVYQSDTDSERCRRCDDGGLNDAPPLASYLGQTCIRCGTTLDDTLAVAGWAWMPTNGVSYHTSGVLVTPQDAVYCATCGPSVAVCRVCGCTDEAGCDEGCAWATADLCSSCVGSLAALGVRPRPALSA